MLNIRMDKTNTPKEKPVPETALGYGKIFTDQMFVMPYTQSKGWHDPNIEPCSNLSLSPATMVFHYGQEMFEGIESLPCTGCQGTAVPA